jgi:hypothetical protein
MLDAAKGQLRIQPVNVVDEHHVVVHLGIAFIEVGGGFSLRIALAQVWAIGRASPRVIHRTDCAGRWLYLEPLVPMSKPSP